MEGRGWIFILTIALLCRMPDLVSSADIVLGPQNATVLSGSNVSFTCTVQPNWQSITWSLKSVYVVNINPSGVTVSPGVQILTYNSTNPNNGDFTSTITIINVDRSNSGLVQCSSLSATTKEAYLSVQVKGSVQIENGSSVTVAPNSTVNISCRASGWDPAPTITWEVNATAASNLDYSTDFTSGTDGLITRLSVFTLTANGDTNLTCLASIQTLTQPESSTVSIAVRERPPGNSSGLSQTDIILIAVFSTVGGLLLLAIIIAIIVICCKKKKKKKKEAGYQSESWRGQQRDVSNPRNTDPVTDRQRNVSNLNADRAFPREYDNRAYTPEPLSVAPSFRSNGSDSAFSEATTTPRSNHVQVNDRQSLDDRLKTIRHVTHV